MAADTYAVDPRVGVTDPRVATESSVSAVSWAAVFGGAIIASATTTVLVLVGSGLGFAMTSPWPNASASATAFTVAAGVWLIVTQWLSSAVGGYITGRLRIKWVRLHTHEVFFRDTAHGFLTWGLATVIGALLLASAGGSVLGTGTRAAATVAGGAAQGATQQTGSTMSPGQSTGLSTEMQAYDVDGLFRGERPELAANDREVKAEATRIMAAGLRDGVPEGDRAYLATLVSSRTGLSQTDARKRVDDTIAQQKAQEDKVREAADKARKSASAFAFFTALSMLIGAFIASAAAAYGGRLRDEHP